MTREEVIGDCRLILGDCREILPSLFGLDAIVTDPPYGIGASRYKRGGTQHGASLAACKVYEEAEWDDAPITPEDIGLVLSAAPHVILFGGNYYSLPPSSCWLVWDKENGDNGYADCELAWTNLPKAVRRIKYMWHGMLRANGEKRGDHPTQKPIGVMSWCIGQLPPTDDLICDPFMGSGTTGVACVQRDKRFIGIERHEPYFEAACRRIEEAYKQPRLFAEPKSAPRQEALL